MKTPKPHSSTTSHLSIRRHGAPEIIAIVGAFVGSAVLVVTLRVLVRSLILKTFGLDDYIMVGSTV